MPFVYCVYEIAFKWFPFFSVSAAAAGGVINEQIVLNNMLNYDVFALKWMG